MDAQLFTYDDAVTTCERFVRTSEKTSMDQDAIRECCETALRELASAAEWNAMRKTLRVFLQPTLPAVKYTYAGKAGTATDYGITTVDREIILSGTAWPGYETPPTSTLDQAGITVLDAELKLGTFTANCALGSVIDATHGQMDANMHPSLDYATAASMMLGFPKYPLPPEFAAGIVAAERNAWFIGTYVSPDQWFLLNKYRTFSGIVRVYTFLPDPKRYGQTALYVHPCPMVATEYDLQIKAWRRPMRISGKEQWNYQGSITLAAGSSDVVGTNTAFDARMVGAVLRVAGAGTQKPTGTAGTNPYLFQQTITSVTDARHMTLSGPSAYALSGVGYSVSDPCDVPASLWDAYKAGCYAQLAQFCAPKEYMAVRARYNIALLAARAADNQDRSVKTVGSGGGIFTRLRDSQNRPTTGLGPSH